MEETVVTEVVVVVDINSIYDVAILGAGAAGLMAASHLKRRKVLIVEHNKKPAAKIAISGGGRCNITNKHLSSSNYLGKNQFVSTVLEQFDNEELLNFLHNGGLKPVVRKESQYFCPNSAKEIIDLLLHSCNGADFLYDAEIEALEKVGDLFSIKTSKGSFYAKKVLVATGGLSFTTVGASGIGYKIAESFGHNIIPTRPALVGLTLQPQQVWMKSLSGLSVSVAITVGRRILTGDMLFAHKGISGPAVLNASLYWNQGKITIDFLPGIKLKSLFKSSKKTAASQIPLPKRFVKAFFDALELPNISYNAMTESQKQRLSLIKSYAFAPAGTFGYTKAEVTKGGILTDEIDPFTMQSHLVDGLFFAGEVVDVTGELGGYNFQWAFSSAVVAARGINFQLTSY
ncbi:aminoacetone oxidase family FAD-binding enzyme [Hydrogenimonas thermophila]|uniref:NAD(P)/FAD-dependent oxidoreductase n=1 Tax=Hydrogenimonas thermophila TaxID=223786 RepID=UPI002936F0A7|nr:aminoacetone oxidase family FAD-binding enzyme [Hydrogenimonas thermophila]WOE70687.1 aminoacetone oxidase family FAD-binding enzyme [Hydrogenimonas thermophila]WOE73205.1 aminoacetone oxidase family FAD-binding enzyme [Hydrogenimonas thermophila]